MTNQLSQAHRYFDALVLVVNSPDGILQSVSFSCICHLVKRIVTQDATYLRAPATVVLPVVIDRLGNVKEPVRTTARRVFEDYWMACPQEAEECLRTVGYKHSDYNVRTECLRMLTTRLQLLENKFAFRHFTPATVELLNDRYDTVRLASHGLLVQFFKTAPLKAKQDLYREMVAQNVEYNIASAVLKEIDLKLTYPRNSGKQMSSSMSSTSSTINSRSVSSSSASSRTSEPNIKHEIDSRPDSRPDSRFNSRLLIHGPETLDTTNLLSMSFITSLPGYGLDPLDAEDISPESFKREVETMVSCFDGKETEFNWLQREKTVIRLRQILRGSLGHDYPDYIIWAIKFLSDGLVKAITSLRTTLSSHGCQLIKEAALITENLLDPVIDPFLSSLVRLTAGVKKVTAQNAAMVVNAMIINTSYSIKFLNHISTVMADKIASPKVFAANWLRLIMARHSDRRQVIESSGGLLLIEKSLLKAINDANPAVRENSRTAFWVYHELWTDRAAAMVDKFDSVTKRALERSKPKPQPTMAVSLKATRTTVCQPVRLTPFFSRDARRDEEVRPSSTEELMPAGNRKEDKLMRFGLRKLRSVTPSDSTVDKTNEASTAVARAETGASSANRVDKVLVEPCPSFNSSKLSSILEDDDDNVFLGGIGALFQPDERGDLDVPDITIRKAFRRFSRIALDTPEKVSDLIVAFTGPNILTMSRKVLTLRDIIDILLPHQLDNKPAFVKTMDLFSSKEEAAVDLIASLLSYKGKKYFKERIVSECLEIVIGLTNDEQSLKKLTDGFAEYPELVNKLPPIKSDDVPIEEFEIKAERNNELHENSDGNSIVVFEVEEKNDTVKVVELPAQKTEGNKDPVIEMAEAEPQLVDHESMQSGEDDSQSASQEHSFSDETATNLSKVPIEDTSHSENESDMPETMDDRASLLEEPKTELAESLVINTAGLDDSDLEICHVNDLVQQTPIKIERENVLMDVDSPIISRVLSISPATISEQFESKLQIYEDPAEVSDECRTPTRPNKKSWLTLEARNKCMSPLPHRDDDASALFDSLFKQLSDKTINAHGFRKMISVVKGAHSGNEGAAFNTWRREKRLLQMKQSLLTYLSGELNDTQANQGLLQLTQLLMLEPQLFVGCDKTLAECLINVAETTSSRVVGISAIAETRDVVLSHCDQKIIMDSLIQSLQPLFDDKSRELKVLVSSSLAKIVTDRIVEKSQITQRLPEISKIILKGISDNETYVRKEVYPLLVALRRLYENDPILHSTVLSHLSSGQQHLLEYYYSSGL